MTTYIIQLAGHLDQRWESSFDGFVISHELAADRPITVLKGPVADQAALYGLLGRLRDLGATLISVQPAGDAEDRTTDRRAAQAGTRSER